MINADKPFLWKEDIDKSVDEFNEWFIEFAPRTYRETRKEATNRVIKAVKLSNDYKDISVEILMDHPEILEILRMSTSPPIARDRLVGLSHAKRNLVTTMEKGRIPPKMTEIDLKHHLGNICRIINDLLDVDIFPWLKNNRKPDDQDRNRASTIVADRLCGSLSNPIIRNAQERRQLEKIKSYLLDKDYRFEEHLSGMPLEEIPKKSFGFRVNMKAGKKNTNIPVDVVIQTDNPSGNDLPVLIEAKSAGDFTNVNKRRKEEATKYHQLQSTFGPDIKMILFLCGYFDAGYLGYEAAEGLDWVWEHRIEDLEKLGV